MQFHETTGAVFDTLAQIHLMRGDYDAAEECLRQASEAYGAYGLQTSRWYEWSVRVLTARLALRRGARRRRCARDRRSRRRRGVPPADAVQADLIAAEALLADGRPDEAEARLEPGRSPPRPRG